MQANVFEYAYSNSFILGRFIYSSLNGNKSTDLLSNKRILPPWPVFQFVPQNDFDLNANIITGI